MNPREKIRQFVIMARHPEAKSYELTISIPAKKLNGKDIQLEKWSDEKVEKIAELI